MNYEDILKALGMDTLEKTVISVVVPYIDAKVKESSPEWDDAAWAKLRPAFLAMVDKINGKKDLPEAE